MHALGDRSLFPDLRAQAYLAHAAVSPLPLPARRAIDEYAASIAAEGAGAYARWLDQREALRADLAGLIGASPADVALVASTTAGILSLALCQPWRAGQRILLFHGEFPTNVTPWQRAAAEWGLGVEMLPLDGFGDGSGAGLARLEAALARGNAALVAVSAVQFQTGLRMPTEEMGALCRRYGAALAVDAIQAVGSTPLTTRGIDFLACGSHKWLMGADGCGFVYVSPDRIASLVPRVAGWLSHEDGIGFLFQGAGHLRYDRALRQRADFLEIGALSSAGFASLGASVSLLRALDPAAIFAHIQRYIGPLEEGLLERGFASLRAPDPAARSGILSVLPPAGVDLVALATELGRRGIACSWPDGKLRLAPHWPNPLSEVPLVLAAFDEALQVCQPRASR